MVQPDNWMGERTPASDTCDQPRHERAAVQAPRRVNASGDSQMGARLRVADLHCSALGDRLLEDVVPHLLRSFSQRADHNARADVRLGAQKAREFADALLDADEAAATRMVDELRTEGASPEELYLGLFSESARLLGYYWETDQLPFSEVTLGLWRLHRMVREISPEFRREREVRSGGMKALLTTVPGEQHSFGLLLVSEWFSRAGWAVVPGPFQTDRDIGRAVGAESLTLAGFSVGSETQLDRVAASIAVVRRKSLNPRIGIMVGGPLFNARPELVQRVGADATAVDAAQALAKAEECVADGLWAS
ncbi:MAG: cobalamin B12-binding domain-containing protein [Beijerinckiaceae bacterium]